MVWKELIFNSFHFGWVWLPGKNCFLTVSNLAGCVGLERTNFNSFYFGRVCWS